MAEQRGRRVPDDHFFDDPQPGDYGKVTDPDGVEHWFNWPPGAEHPGVLKIGVEWTKDTPDGNLGLFHQVIEHEDGTITVQPSILQRGVVQQVNVKPGAINSPEWHGFLERGVWRDA
jgi:hypothetical protein